MKPRRPSYREEQNEMVLLKEDFQKLGSWKSIPEKSKCKGPEAEVSLVCCRNFEEPS